MFKVSVDQSDGSQGHDEMFKVSVGSLILGKVMMSCSRSVLVSLIVVKVMMRYSRSMYSSPVVVKVII